LTLLALGVGGSTSNDLQPVLLHIGRVVHRDVPDARYVNWLLRFSRIPTRPGGVLVKSCQIYDFLVRRKWDKWLLQVMIGNRDELKGNQDQQVQ